MFPTQARGTAIPAKTAAETLDLLVPVEMPAQPAATVSLGRSPLLFRATWLPPSGLSCCTVPIPDSPSLLISNPHAD